MKKVIIVLIVAILIVGGIIGFNLKKKSKKDTSQSQTQSQQQPSYGRRGNISENQRIKFISKNDEYLIGMMGLSVSNEVKKFSNDDMIRVAVERYATMLDTTRNGKFIINTQTVNSITEEYFGKKKVSFDKNKNKFYSLSNKAFVFDTDIEKTLYYYPVSQEKKDDGTTEITADAIFINDETDTEKLDKAKYEGAYEAENVDNTIKFIFNEKGYLTSYQYLK